MDLCIADLIHASVGIDTIASWQYVTILHLEIFARYPLVARRVSLPCLLYNFLWNLNTFLLFRFAETATASFEPFSQSLLVEASHCLALCPFAGFPVSRRVWCESFVDQDEAVLQAQRV